MEIVRKNNLNVRKTVEKAINNHPEFHFFVDELSADNRMPTYAGIADEKYTFDEMDDGFFDFINRKIQENGVYLRICYMTGQEVAGEAIFVTIDGGCAHTPYFAEFGSKNCNETFMSLENPLNRYIISLIGEFLDSI